MKHLFNFLFIPLLLFSVAGFAQNNYEDVVYLRNGSIIRGIIIEQVPNESLKIQTHDRNVFVFRMDEIAKITKEEVSAKKRREKPTQENIKKKGFTNITEITIGRDILNNNEDNDLGDVVNNLFPSFGIQTVNGYLFNPYLSLGLGIGLHYYFDVAFVPLFADVRLNMVDHTATPFISVGAGYSFPASDIYGIDGGMNYDGGAYFNPAFGIKFFTRKSMALAFSLGFRLQQTRIYGTDNFPHQWEKASLGYLNLKIGFVF